MAPVHLGDTISLNFLVDNAFV